MDPADYRKGSGFTGVLLALANWLRMLLEAWIVKTIYRLELRASGLSPEQIRKAENTHETFAHRPPSVTAFDLGGDSLLAGIARASQREGRKNSDGPETVVPIRLSQTLNGAFSVFAAKKGLSRQARYALGREIRTVYDSDPQEP